VEEQQGKAGCVGAFTEHAGEDGDGVEADLHGREEMAGLALQAQYPLRTDIAFGAQLLELEAAAAASEISEMEKKALVAINSTMSREISTRSIGFRPGHANRKDHPGADRVVAAFIDDDEGAGGAVLG
jgi:hypothetical protein